jgi:hypothetical protein
MSASWLGALGEMTDTYRECAQSMMSFLWALSLFGAEQVAKILASRQAGPARLQEADALAAITHATETQLGAAGRAAFQAGDRLQRGMVDLMYSLATLDVLTPRHMTKVTFEAMQQSAEVCKFLMPGRENRIAWQEFKNKLQAFDLFEHVDVILCLPSGPEMPLTAVVEKTTALGPYRAVWAMEGLGRYYAEMHWEHRGTPQHLLTADQVRALPASSLIPLHTGMGLSLADRLLATLRPRSSEADIDSVLQQFSALCRHNSREGYAGAALEGLGLVTRLRYPELVGSIDGRLSAMAPDLDGYFWHGVGRGLYFLPINALPCSSSNWRAIEMAQAEAPHTLARLNALGGLAWAVALVNIRHPAVLETFLKCFGDLLATNDAFSAGVSSALMVWHDMDRGDASLRALLQHQPDAADRRLVQLWNSQVKGPSEAALSRYGDVLKAWHGLGRLFRYQPLTALADQFEGEPVA